MEKRWKRKRIEFEYKSSNFITHKHDPTKCVLVICWINGRALPIETLELASKISHFYVKEQQER